jgi:hypothetical protein
LQILLTIIVDKIGDADKKVSSRAGNLLQKLGILLVMVVSFACFSSHGDWPLCLASWRAVQKHPNMRAIVIREVCRCDGNVLYGLGGCHVLLLM